MLGGRVSSGELHLLVGQHSIKIMSEGEWKKRNHGASYYRQWRKVHRGIDAGTLDIRAIEVSANETGDAPMFPGLMAKISEHERITSLSADRRA